MEVSFKSPYLSFIKPYLNHGIAVGITLFIIAPFLFGLLLGFPQDRFEWISTIIASLISAIIGGLSTTLFEAFVIFLLRLGLPITLDTDGITSFNHDGHVTTLKWYELDDISIESIGMFSYYMMKTRNDSAILIPLSIRDIRRFDELVVEYSKLSNPEFSKTFKKFVQNSEAST